MKCRPPAHKPQTSYRRQLALVVLLASMVFLLSGTLFAQGRETPFLALPAHVAPPMPLTNTSIYAQPQSFSTISPTITLAMPLGSKQTVELQLTNVTSTSITPILYEAWQEPPPGITFPLTGTATTQKLVLPNGYPRTDPQIWADLAAAPDNQTTFFVYLQDQADLTPAYSVTDWAERGWYVYTTLRQHAEMSQQDIRAWLEQQHLSYRSHWIVNALVVEGSTTDLLALEARADVALLRANHLVNLGVTTTPSALTSCREDDQGICWNIKQINAHRVWKDYGISGQGITIAHIDSGVRLTHPALVQQYRGYLGPDSYTHTYNWYDPVSSAATPNDAGNHGTHTMGTMAARGDGTTSQPAVGVAPGVHWIAARGCGSSACKETTL